MKRSLLPPQKMALKYAFPLNKIALFMEMRLGKTTTCIRWLEEKKTKQNLIITPSSVISVWVNELTEEGYHSREINILTGKSTERIRLAEERKLWNIINYEGMLACPEIFAMNWDAVVLDESTKIKNSKAQITKLINKEFQEIPYKAILSGYPCPESAMDYFEQFKFLDGNFMGFDNFWAWRNVVCVQLGFRWVIKDRFKEQLKKLVEEKAFILTRKEAGLGSRKIYSRRFIKMNPVQRKVYSEIKKNFSCTFKKHTKETKWIPVKLEWMSQVASGFAPPQQFISDLKYRELLYLLKGELKGQKVVVWFRHNIELNFVYQKLIALKKFSVGRFTAEFKEGNLNKDTNILLVQSRCGMMGLNWSAASTSIYYSNWPSGEIRVQSEDRIIHPQKKEPVLYIDLLTENSIDIHLLDLLKNKKLNAKEFLFELSRRVLDDNGNN